MIFELLARTFPEQDLEAVFETFASGRNVRVAGLRAAARAFYLTLLSPRLRMPVVCLAPTVKQAEDLFADLVFLEQCFHPERGSGGSRVVTFPAPDTEPYQGVSPHPQISVQRMQALWRLTQGDLDFLIAPVQAAARVLPPPENLQRSFDILDLKNEEGPIAIAARLRGYGYREKDLVTSRGEFSLRGGILDFYSPAEDFPIRVEFFGNRIESLRAFDTTTQRSIQGAERATVLALREMLLTQPEIDRWGEFSSTR
ncbi:MAG TPA: hypothetical protein VLR94_02970, partial [Acidobacteriota bacterium]|nr:hypothetical protein [Acidobacteriota bacterium]